MALSSAVATEKPRAAVTPLNAPYFEALAAGRLVLQRCNSCATYIYYPRVVCPRCLSSDLSWTEASGRAAVVSFAEVHKPQHPAFNDDVPIPLVAVALEEGPVMFARLSPNTGPVEIGQLLELDAEATRDASAYVVFRHAG